MGEPMRNQTGIGVKLDLPGIKEDKHPIKSSLESILSQGELLQSDGTNVVRVPFGVRQPRRKRSERAASAVTLVIPFNPSGGPTPPPQAA